MPTGRILVVENNDQARRVAVAALRLDPVVKSLQLEISIATDGVQGLESIQQQRPLAMVVELLLPRMDGLELIQRVRQEPNCGDLPIIATNSIRRDQHQLATLEQLGVIILVKPFSPQALVKRLHQLLRRIKVAARPAIKRTPSRAKTRPSLAPEPRTRLSPEPQIELSPEPSSTPARPRPAPKEQGDLSQRSLAQLLLDALEQGTTGYISLSRDKVYKRIFLVQGQPVFVHSNLRNETLGQILVGRGRLTRAQHQQALGLMNERGIKYGEALVQQGQMTQREVTELLSSQARYKIEAGLAWREGTWEHVDDPTVAQRQGHYAVNPLAMLCDALPRYMETEKVLEQLGTGAESFQLVMNQRGLKLGQAFAQYCGTQVLEAISAGKSVAEMFRDVGLQPALEQLYILLECGMATRQRRERPSATFPVCAADLNQLDSLANRARTDQARARRRSNKHQPAARQRRQVQATPLALSCEPLPESLHDAGGESWTDDATPRLGAPAVDRVFNLPPLSFDTAIPNEAPDDTIEVQAVDCQQLESAQRLIGTTFVGLSARSHYQVLEVPRNCSADVIEVAYSVKRKQFDPVMFRELDLGQQYDQLVEIRERLDLAYMVLSNEALRREYDAGSDEDLQTDDCHSPLLAEASYETGEFLAAAGRHQEAAEVFAEAQVYDQQPEYRAMEAWAVFRARGETPEAAEEVLHIVDEALQYGPDQAPVHMVAAWIHRAARHHSRSARHFREAIYLDPCAQRAFNGLEQLLLELGQLEQLEQDYRSTIARVGESDPEWSAELWKRLTDLYARQLEDQLCAETAGSVAEEMSAELELELFPD